MCEYKNKRYVLSEEDRERIVSDLRSIGVTFFMEEWENVKSCDDDDWCILRDNMRRKDPRATLSRLSTMRKITSSRSRLLFCLEYCADADIDEELRLDAEEAIYDLINE